MAKFKDSFVSGYEERQKREKEQQNLKNKYKIENENVIVVEKNNMVKFTTNTLIRAIKFVASITLITLACIGLYAIINPDIRAQLNDNFISLFNELKQSIGI